MEIMCILKSRWKICVLLPLKEIISIKYILARYALLDYKWKDMTGCALLFFHMKKFKNSVFCLVISTKALSNLSYSQHHILTRQREE